jgi:hypothetical protein
MTSREFASWPDPLEECRQNARTLQGKYQDTAKALDRAHRALTRIAARHSDDGHGECAYCLNDRGIHDPFPCPDYLDATGASHG